MKRVLNIPAKFGNIAKAYVTRDNIATTFTGVNNMDSYSSFITSTQNISDKLLDAQEYFQSALQSNQEFGTSLEGSINDFLTGYGETGVNTLAIQLYNQNKNQFETESELLVDEQLGTINIYVLGYNNLKQLVGNPHVLTTLTDDNLPNTLMSNIKKYLENFKIMTDVITINDGYIVNFGVIFDIIAEKYANKQQVKLNCIQKIKDYFAIEKCNSTNQYLKVN